MSEENHSPREDESQEQQGEIWTKYAASSSSSADTALADLTETTYGLQLLSLISVTIFLLRFSISLQFVAGTLHMTIFFIVLLWPLKYSQASSREGAILP